MNWIWSSIQKFIGCLLIIHGVIWLVGTFTSFYSLPAVINAHLSDIFPYSLNLVLVVFQIGTGLFLIIDKWRPKIWWFLTAVAAVFVIVTLVYFIARGNKPAFGLGG